MTDILLTKGNATLQVQSIYQDPQYVRSYDAGHYGGDFGNYIHDQEVETFSSLVTSGTRLLDLGSGTGKLALALAGEFDTVVCADSSFEMLSVLKRKALEEGIDVACVLTDAQQLCFRRDAFDSLVSSRVLMHLEDWRLGVSELSRVTREVVLDFPPLLSFAGLSLILRGAIARLGVISREPRAISLTGIRLELERHDRVANEWRKAYFFPISLHRRLNRSAVTRRIEEPFRRLGITRLFGAPVTLRASDGSE
ncbi:MAG: class I SAM-dependent methyltransferase [Anaerolineales bacterium]